MNFEQVACVCALEIRRRKMKKKNNIGCFFTAQQTLKGQFHKLYSDLRYHPEKFFEYYRMNVNSFDDLLNSIGPPITYQDTKWRNAISPEERLSVTLR